MEKDQYAFMKMRQDIASKYLDKLATVGTDDIQLLPALIEYIKTGDTEKFEAYTQFLTEYKLQEKEEHIKIYEEKLNHLEEKTKEQEERKNKCLSQLNMLSHEDFAIKDISSYDSLFKFIKDKNINSKKYIFVKIDDEVYRISGLQEIDGKIVLTTDSSFNQGNIERKILREVDLDDHYKNFTF